MNGDIAVRSITASISLWIALSAPRTICSVTGSQTHCADFAETCANCLVRLGIGQRRDKPKSLPQDTSAAGFDERGMSRLSEASRVSKKWPKAC